MSLTDLMDEWLSFHVRHNTPLPATRRPGASDERLEAFTQLLENHGATAPPELLELYRWADGFGGGIGTNNFLPMGEPFIDLDYSVDQALKAMGNGWHLDTLHVRRLGHAENPETNPDDAAEWTVPVFASSMGFFEVDAGQKHNGGFWYSDESRNGWTARSLTEFMERLVRFYHDGWIIPAKTGSGVSRLAINPEVGDPAAAINPATGFRQWYQDLNEFPPDHEHASLAWRWDV